MDKCVFVHTNEKQWLGALVAEYSFRRNSLNPDAFEVKFIHTRDYPFLAAKEDRVDLPDFSMQVEILGTDDVQTIEFSLDPEEVERAFAEIDE